MPVFFNPQFPLRKFSSLLLIGLSLSIGWGIRGNFGHEYGAAFAGSLAAIAAAVLSGRADWRNKVHYFALFGAIGWGFGASMSYMQVIAYTQSGHALSQWYGFICLFIIGFLWAAVGGIGTALPAAMERERIIKLFTPLLFVLGARIVLGIIEDPVARWMEAGIHFDQTASRHKNPLYWFDAYYLPAFSALAGIGLYDLWQRRGEKNRRLLPLFLIMGGLVGFLIQLMMRKAGIAESFAASFTYLQGDPSYINPDTGTPAYEATNLLNNWPQWFGDYPQHVGWVAGCIAGATVYFFKYGKFRNGASLIVYMATGWLIAFFAFPVLGSKLFTSYGGIRMTPPRSDDWAGILGLFIGAMIWLWKNNLRAVARAAIICGTIGGLGFSGVQWIKTILMSFGNPDILTNKGILPGSAGYITITARWTKWQAQNWHSFLEQTYGFVNGIAIAVAMALLASRIKNENVNSNENTTLLQGRWTRALATLSILFGLTYFNVVKNVEEWSDQLDPAVWTQKIIQPDGTETVVPAQWDLPYLGRLPGLDFLHLSPESWFTLTWVLLVIAVVFIVRKHFHTPVAFIPSGDTGKGQLIFLLLLWTMTIANFERALTGWHSSRMLTEWVIFVNAIIATALILILPSENVSPLPVVEQSYKPLLKKYLRMMAASMLIAATLFTFTNRWIYHYPKYDQLDLKRKNIHTRFGPEADWRAKPNFKNAEHK